ncbi:S41 family peptidase [Couchioplanes caeruleus]|uniref:S41 family peptidase n=1 Tax=Couchioplanes caeruleus TaxID=56438 RepID=UPI003D314049
MAGRLLGDDATHLSDVTYRDRVRQWWTPDLPAGTALTQPPAVLVSGHTYSSAEALAHHLQARGRAIVVGGAVLPAGGGGPRRPHRRHLGGHGRPPRRDVRRRGGAQRGIKGGASAAAVFLGSSS